MAYTFLAAQGHQVGDSLLQAEQIPQVTAALADAAKAGVEVVLPVDHVVADRFAADAAPEIVPGRDIPDGKMGLDIGPATRELFARKLADAKDRVLERAARGVRVPRVRRRHAGGRRGDQRRDRADRRGRR